MISDSQIEALKKLIGTKTVVWQFDVGERIYVVESIHEHPEEGEGIPCAIFSKGYVSLDNATPNQFFVLSNVF